MRRPALLAAVAAVALTARAAHSQQLSAAADYAIRRQVQELIDATNANPMATLEKYVRSDDVTSINDETIVRGWAALVQQTEATAPGSLSIRLGIVNVIGMGSEHALAVAPFTLTYQTNNGPVNVPGSMTLAFASTAGGWKILHEHYSTGLDEQSKRRLNEAASGGSALSMGDLVNLFLTAMGGGAGDVAMELAKMLLVGSACPN